MAGVKVPLGQIPVPSPDITRVETVHRDGTLTIRFEFFRDGGMWRGGVVFPGVRAIAWRAEGHCTSWHIQGAYDTIAEVTDSGWIDELHKAEQPESWRVGGWMIHHFMLYLDSEGCYEVAAESWTLLPEEYIGPATVKVWTREDGVRAAAERTARRKGLSGPADGGKAGQ